MVHESILFLSEDDVLSMLTPQDAIEAAESIFYHIGTGEVTVGEMALMFTDESKRNNFHSMPAILHYKNVAGVKWISTYGAPAPGYPFCHGTIVLLSDTRTGSPIAVVGGTNITALRTAGGHGVVQAKHLANPEPGVLTVMGCGAQAQAGIRGFLTQFDSIKEVRLFSRSRPPMERVKEAYKDRAKVVICPSPQEAARGSSLILVVSGAYEPLLGADMVRPGTTIIGIEGFRDIDPALGKRADKWYLGYRVPDQYILDSPKLNPGKLQVTDVFGDMTELLTGRVPGREREDEIIISTHMGMGAHDVYCAELVYRRALERGIGQRLCLA